MSSAVLSSQRLAPPISKKTVKLAVVGIGFVIATVWSWIYIHMTFGGLFGGFSDLWRLLQRMFPPDFYQLSAIVSATVETLWMALIGTAIAVLLSIPLAFGVAATPHHTQWCLAFAVP